MTMAKSTISNSLPMIPVPTAAASILCQESWDRSPCSTGTSAKLAYLAEDNWQLQPGELWQQAVLSQASLPPAIRARNASIISDVRGAALVCGDTRRSLSPDDPFCWGSCREPRRRHRDRRGIIQCRHLRVAAGEAGKVTILLDDRQPTGYRRPEWGIWCMDDDPPNWRSPPGHWRWRLRTRKCPALRQRGRGTLWLAETSGWDRPGKTAADGRISVSARCRTPSRLTQREPLLRAGPQGRTVGSRRWYRLRP